MNNEPVAWMYEDEPWFDGNKYHKRFELTFSEKVAIFKSGTIEKPIPLYTHPAEITDEEIISTMVQFDVYSSDDHCLIEAGRAILRKASEK